VQLLRDLGSAASPFNAFLVAAGAATMGAILYPRTAAEIAAGVTPTNYAYTAGDWRRFGFSTSGTAAANAAAANNALAVGGLSFIDDPGTYVVDDNLDIRSNSVARIGAGVIIQGAAGKAWVDTGIIDIDSRDNVCIELYGTVDGNNIKFHVAAGIPLDYTGTVDGDSMSGTMSGRGKTGDWKATRAK